jgi:hypothetical protein
MSISAVLGAVASTPEGKDRAFRAGGIDVMYRCIRSHGDHNGFRTWACGCLSNLLTLSPAADAFVALGGIELLMDIIKV